jgi:26S proteasome regulatory subunit N9
MALIDSVFRRNANNRTLSFQTIAEETRLPLNEVEHLVMKALRFVFFLLFSLLVFTVRSLSLKLIKGSLDQVERKAVITWVQPRVLSREQIGGLANRLEDWVDKLKNVEAKIAPEVLVQGA